MIPHIPWIWRRNFFLKSLPYKESPYEIAMVKENMFENGWVLEPLVFYKLSYEPLTWVTY